MPENPTETPPTPGQEPAGAETPPEVPPENPQLSPETPPETPPEMSPEEKRDHDMRSWIGRRDVEIRAEMDKRDQAILNEIRNIPTVTTEPSAEAPDPTLDADAWFEHKLEQRLGNEQAFNKKLVDIGLNLIQQDELVKADPKMGEEIYKEIQSGQVPINRTLPPEIAADIAITKAKSNILTRRMTEKTNPLEKNTPITVPVGGVTPPAASTTPVVKLPEMSDLAKGMASKWGLSNEEVAKILK